MVTIAAKEKEDVKTVYKSDIFLNLILCVVQMKIFYLSSDMLKSCMIWNRICRIALLLFRIRFQCRMKLFNHNCHEPIVIKDQISMVLIY